MENGGVEDSLENIFSAWQHSSKHDHSFEESPRKAKRRR